MRRIIIMLIKRIKRPLGEADVLKLLRELLTQHINTFYHIVNFLQKVFRGKKMLVFGCPGNEIHQSWSWSLFPTAVVDVGLGH